MDDVVWLDALDTSGAYRSYNRADVTDVTGTQLAELSLVPTLAVHRGLAALRQSEVPPPERRKRALQEAARRFAGEKPGGLSVEDYEYRVSRVSGLPITSVRAATLAITHAVDLAYETALASRPWTAVESWKDLLSGKGAGVWTRRGEVLAVHAPGNHPAVHAGWIEALALGYRVAVRPSRREPFTPHRLVAALREAGFGNDQVIFLPTEHAVAEELIVGADLAIVYGGDDVVRRYRDDPAVLSQGPGRSKILLGDPEWKKSIDMIVNSVAGEGGAACINATALFVNGDPAPVAAAIAERLSRFRALPPEDEGATLPVYDLTMAHALGRRFEESAGDAHMWLGGNGVVEELGDGSAALRPAVAQVIDPNDHRLGVELPFPCVWVAPWSAEHGIDPLRNTLVLTAIGCPERLLDQLIDEPSISNIHIGHQPTHWQEPGIPHDGYLTGFLMRGKGVVRA